MGILKSAMKTGVAIKGFQMVREQMNKPENRAKAQQAFEKFQQSRKARKTR